MRQAQNVVAQCAAERRVTADHMLQIIDARSTGKTRQLLTYANNHHCIVVCSNPTRMKDKSIRYGLGYLDCVSYDEFLANYREGAVPDGTYVVDELDKLVAMMFPRLDGYCLTVEDKPSEPLSAT